MISEAEALRHVLDAVKPGPIETVATAEAVGRFITHDLQARFPSPLFDNSAMDGYAVNSAEAVAGARLKVTSEQPAGRSRGLSLSAGSAIRIFTGAPLPKGADAVVMQEDVTCEGEHIGIAEAVSPGENVRRAGIDLCEGQVIVHAGDVVTPSLLGLLSSQGIWQVDVGGQPHVAILVTGNELRSAGEELLPGEIYDSNRPMLAAMVESWGGRVHSTGHATDDRESLDQNLREAMRADIVVISGGVSVGEHDLVKDVLKDLGVRIDLWRVAIKPGKPFLFGTKDRTLIFGLPGNPVSSFVTALLFVRPAILKMRGALNVALPEFPARLTMAVNNPGERAHYLRGIYQDGHFQPFGLQQSHAVHGLAQANALLRLDAGCSLSTDAVVTISPI